MRIRWAGYAWTIEYYHRGIKQFRGIERAQVRAARAQRNHIGLCLRAFLRLESHCYRTGISWFEAKTTIIRAACGPIWSTRLYLGSNHVTSIINQFEIKRPGIAAARAPRT